MEFEKAKGYFREQNALRKATKPPLAEWREYWNAEKKGKPYQDAVASIQNRVLQDRSTVRETKDDSSDKRRFFINSADAIGNLRKTEFVDYDEAERELDLLHDTIGGRLDAIFETGNLLLSTKEHAAWQNLAFSWAMNLSKFADQIHDFGRVQDNTTSTSEEYSSGLFNNLFGELRSYRIFNEIERTAKKHNFYDQHSTDFDLLRFHSYGNITTPVFGFSVLDFLEGVNLRKKTPSERLAFLAQVNAAYASDDFTAALPDEQSEFTRLYPQLTRDRILHAVRYFVTAAEEDEAPKKSADQQYKSKENTTGKKYRDKLVGNLKSISNEAYENLFNNVQGREIQEIVREYLNGNRIDRLMILSSLGLTDIDKLVRTYRYAKDQLNSGNNDDFYLNIIDAIEDFSEELPVGASAVTRDDISSFHEKTELPEKIPGFTEMASEISQIFTANKERNFRINPENIHLAGFIMPTEINILFGQKPHSFTLSFKYENEYGEALDFNLSFTTKGEKGTTFDWRPLLDPPDDPSLAYLRDSSFVVAYNVLGDVRQQIEERKKRGVFVGNAPQSTTQTSQKRERVKDEMYAIRREARKEGEASNAMPLAASVVDKGRVVTAEIVAPSDERYAKDINEAEMKLVEDAIRVFNETGNGKFTKKKRQGKYKEDLYTLAIKSPHGGIRVLMTKGEGRNFNILDIRHRDDVYRRAGI